MKPKKWTIYCHIHNESDRKYIGITQFTMMHRWNQHCSQAKKSKNSHFQNAIRKYGKDAFSHEVLRVCNSLEEANTAEIEEIAKYDTTNPEKGFNKKLGGAHTPHPVKIKKNPWDDHEYRERHRIARSQPEAIKNRLAAQIAHAALWNDPEYKERMSKISREILSRPEVKKKLSKISKERMNRPEVKEKMSKAFKGKKQSPEAIENNRLAQLGKKLSHEHIEKMRKAHIGVPISIEHKAKMSEFYERKYEQKIVKEYQLCKKHGIMLKENFYEGRYSNGRIRLLCKLCSNERKLKRYPNLKTRGYLTNLVKNFLIENKGTAFTSTQLQRLLNIKWRVTYSILKRLMEMKTIHFKIMGIRYPYHKIFWSGNESNYEKLYNS